jgi:hypothetical protein
MSLLIDNPELERQLRALAAERGESVEDVLRQALSHVGQPEHAPKQQKSSTEPAGAAHPANVGPSDVPDWLADLQEEYRRHVVDRTSTDDELLGYDEDGLPR